MTGFLALEDGTVFHGESVGAEGFACGEAVFTTGMSGYQEVVTDPSFAEQLVCFTAPMVGNYGVDDSRSESRRAHARAVLMREARGPAWTDWLHERGVLALTGIDTRTLVLKLRESGAMRAVVVAGDSSEEEAIAAAREQLVAETDAEDRRAAEQVADDSGLGLERRGIAGSRREQHTVEVRELVRVDVMRIHGHRGARLR